MHTDVTITRNGDGSGYANGVTHIWEITDLRGFRGSVAVAVLDQNKKLLWVSRTLSYGVDGRLIGTSDRTVNWNDTVPGQLMPQIRYIAIIQKPSPDVYDDISRWLKGIGSVADELAPIIKAVMTVLAG